MSTTFGGAPLNVSAELAALAVPWKASSKRRIRSPMRHGWGGSGSTTSMLSRSAGPEQRLQHERLLHQHQPLLRHRRPLEGATPPSGSARPWGALTRMPNLIAADAILLRSALTLSWSSKTDWSTSTWTASPPPCTMNFNEDWLALYDVDQHVVEVSDAPSALVRHRHQWQCRLVMRGKMDGISLWNRALTSTKLQRTALFIGFLRYLPSGLFEDSSLSKPTGQGHDATSLPTDCLCALFDLSLLHHPRHGSRATWIMKDFVDNHLGHLSALASHL